MVFKQMQPWFEDNDDIVLVMQKENHSPKSQSV